MKDLMRALNEWQEREFHIDELRDMGIETEGLDFSDLEHIGLVYTQSLDGEHDIEWEANLKALTLTLLIDGEESKKYFFPSTDSMTQYIDRLWPDELVGQADRVLEEEYE